MIDDEPPEELVEDSLAFTAAGKLHHITCIISWCSSENHDCILFQTEAILKGFGAQEHGDTPGQIRSQ